MLAAGHWRTRLAVPRRFRYFYAAFAHVRDRARCRRANSLVEPAFSSIRRTVFPRRTASTFRNSHFDSARYVPPHLDCAGRRLLVAVTCASSRRAQPGGMGWRRHADSPALDVRQEERQPAKISGLSLSATDEPVAEIRIVGNKTIPTSQILNQLQTRVGRPFDPALVQRDVRKLTARGWFVDVQPTYEQTPNGRIVIFKVVERPIVRYVEYLGNDGIRDKKLAKETDLKVGGSVDPYAVEEARRKIIDLYHRNGFNNVASHHPGRQQADRPGHRVRDQRRHRPKDLEGRVRRQRVRQRPAGSKRRSIRSRR